jgi:hypothetical protein
MSAIASEAPDSAPCKRVFGAAVNDALGFDRLPAAEAGAFHHYRREALPTQARVEPEAGNACADNQNVSGKSRWHEHLKWRNRIAPL